MLGNWKQIPHPFYLPFCPSLVLLLRLHSLLCVLRNKTKDKQKFFVKWVGYLFPVTLIKNSKLFPLGLFISLSFLISNTGYAKSAKELGREIIQQASDRDDGFGDMKSEVTMTLKHADGSENTRFLTVKTLEVKKDGEKRLFSFNKPKDIKGTTVLNYGHILADDDQWIYLPAFKRVKRISSSNKNSAFVSSEFAYEDLTSIEVDNYTQRYLEDSQIDALDCYKVELIPAYENSGYSQLIAYIDKKDYLFQKVEFYDLKKTLLKTLILSGYQQYKDRYWRPDITTMTNHQTNKETVMEWNKISLQTGLSDMDFSRNALKRYR